MKRLCRIACLITIAVVVSVSASSPEAGAFDRLSVTFLNTLISLDNSAQALSSYQKETILTEIKKSIMMPRFDYNPIPESVERVVLDEIDGMFQTTHDSKEPRIDQVTGFMNRYVVPEVVKYVDAAKELRAQQLMTEQERNSFITDKAKEIGITADQLKKVMNSAFIFVPVVADYTGFHVGEAYTASITMGVIWWRIEVSGDKSGAEIVVQEMKKSVGVGTKGNYYGNIGNYRQFAFSTMVENGAEALRVATQKIPAFQLSGQIIERSGNRVTFDLGNLEGVHIDMKYQIVELEEDNNGGVSASKKGWIVVSDVGDSTGENGYVSEGRIASGVPYIGAIVHEYPRQPFELTLGYRQFTIQNDLYKTITYGASLNANYNFGPKIGVSQLFLGIGGSMGVGSIKKDTLLWMYPAETQIDDQFVNGYLHAQVIKKFQYRRALLGIELGGGYSAIMSDFFDTITGYSLFGNGLVEIAISPSINLGGKVGWDFTPDSEQTGANGLGIGAYISWTPPGTPVSPVDLVRGLAGI